MVTRRIPKATRTELRLATNHSRSFWIGVAGFSRTVFKYSRNLAEKEEPPQAQSFPDGDAEGIKRPGAGVSVDFEARYR